MRNPLISPILAILKDHPNGISEFDMLKSLKAQLPILNQLANDANLQLFRQHFLIMNALYQLQTSLWHEEKLMLSINTLHIKLLLTEKVHLSNSTELNDSVEAKLATYYLDWSEYEKTDEKDVSQLLNSFYQGSLILDTDSQNSRNEALKTLQINESNPSKTVIKQQYRKLAQHHHPDRGGDQETFINLRQAYEYLIF